MPKSLRLWTRSFGHVVKKRTFTGHNLQKEAPQSGSTLNYSRRLKSSVAAEVLKPALFQAKSGMRSEDRVRNCHQMISKRGMGMKLLLADMSYLNLR
jgi:hypothetical protein